MTMTSSHPRSLPLWHWPPLPATADMKAAEKWVDQELKPSTLSRPQQLDELKWFIEAAQKLRGKGVTQVNVVSETIKTHEYESKTLARAFEEITGIKVKHDLIQEGDVVEKLADVDAIGQVHLRRLDLRLRSRSARTIATGPSCRCPITWRARARSSPIPTLDLNDFIGTRFTTAPDGKLYQLPDQQFANLYWFRADWFARKDLQKRFKDKYGYDLGVPLNWSAYEDIADFFTNEVKQLDGKQRLRPHGLRQEGPVARLALHRRLAVHGRHRRPRHPQRAAGRRVGHPRRRRQVRARRRLGRARRRRPTRRPPSSR